MGNIFLISEKKCSNRLHSQATKPATARNLTESTPMHYAEKDQHRYIECIYQILIMLRTKLIQIILA